MQDEQAKKPPSTDDKCRWSGLYFRKRESDCPPIIFDSYMQGRNVVRIEKLRSGSPSGDWVTIGVVTSKTTKMSSQGKSYTIWRLSNLTRDGSILLFLFGGAHHAFWKEFEGEIVAILNPQLSENRERKDDDTPAYSISNEAQIKKMGKSRDYGTCASLRLDGQRCNNVVNLKVTKFCDCHIHIENKKANAKRANLQASQCAKRLCPPFASGTYILVSPRTFILRNFCETARAALQTFLWQCDCFCRMHA